MIVGIGIDIEDVAEIQGNIDKHGDKYLQRMFVISEIEYSSKAADPYQSFAGRIAAKEALMKALGTGWDQDIDWKDIEISHEPAGRPVAVLHGAAAKRAATLGVQKIWISLSHTVQFTVAQAVLDS